MRNDHRNVSRETGTSRTSRSSRLLHRRLRLEGRVQGVGMRWFAVTRAEALGLDGWVKNRLDGSVDMEFQGDERSVERMTVLMRRGAPYSQVVHVDQKELPIDKSLQGKGFDVRYNRREW